MKWALTLVGMLLATAVILYLAYFVTRQIASGGLGKQFGGGAGTKMRLLDQMAVGQDRRLLVVAVGTRFFVVGSSAAGMQLIAELTEQEAEQWNQPPTAGAGTPASFGEILSRTFGRRDEKK